MKRFAIALVLLAGCGKEESSSSPSSSSSGPSWKAATPKEFFDSFTEAAGKGDWITVYRNAFSKKLREEVEGDTKKRIERWAKEPAVWEKDKKDYKLDREPGSYTVEEVFAARQKLRMEESPRTFTFVSADEKDGKATVKTKRKNPKTGAEVDDDWELVKEDGVWRMEED